jgi:hypothetical protein
LFGSDAEQFTNEEDDDDNDEDKAAAAAPIVDLESRRCCEGSI